MILDLRPSFTAVKRKLHDMIQQFTEENPDVAVTALELEFDIDPGGVSVHIDTRSKYKPGTADEMEYTSYDEWDMGKWGEFDAALFEDSCRLTTHLGDVLEFTPSADGDQYEVEGENLEHYAFDTAGDHFIQALGLMLLDAVAEVRDEGGFDEWQLNSPAVYNVEDVHGHFAHDRQRFPSLRSRDTDE